MGLPGLTVSTGLVGRDSRRRAGRSLGRYREDLCLLAGEAIEAGGTPPSPIDPVRLRQSRIETRCLAFTISRATSLAGEDVPLKRFEGKVLLIVNTASACGFTPQYKGLEALHRELSPARLFRARISLQPVRRPGTGRRQADRRVLRTASMTSPFRCSTKIDVNGANAHPLYNYLKGEKSGLLGSSIKWNFTKFLVDRSGKVVARHAPTAKPEGLKKEIEALL